MRSFDQFLRGGFILLLSSLFLFSCDLIDGDDPCDDTTASEIQARLIPTVYVLDKDGDPLEGLFVRLVTYKIPCGADAKGRYEVNGTTSSAGIVHGALVIYNLRNKEDQVVVDVYVPDLGNGSASANSEYAYYKYDNFTSGITKNVDVYVHRNF